MEFYSPANTRSDLWQVVALYRKSCALTIADKHKLKTAAAVFKRYGPLSKQMNVLDSCRFVNLREGFQGFFVEHRLRDILECLITEC